MKKIISIILSICFLLATLVGCAQNNDVAKRDEEASDKISVITTIFAPYDFVREIAGDDVDVSMLLSPGSESHSYEPTPQDIINIQNCDVFIYVGGDSDEWVNQILEPMDTSKMKIIALMDCVDVVEEEIVEGMDGDHGHDHAHDTDGPWSFIQMIKNFFHNHDHDHDDEHDEGPEFDEHVWTSPKNAKKIVERISEVLCEVDDRHADNYQERTNAYLAQIDELDAAFQTVVDNSVRKTLLFGDRFPFRYFADAYGLEYFAAFPGCSTDSEASAATIAFLIDKVNAENIPVVFHAELSNQKMANIISEATGAKVLLLHACHNVTRDEMTDNATYLSLMRQNVENLKEALN